MSLPIGFAECSLYFQECMIFLKNYKWIYTSSNTQFLKNEIFKQFPIDWQEYFTTVANSELNAFPASLNKQDLVPESLQHLQNKLLTLKPSIPHEYIDDNSIVRKGMSPKKSHEITQLAKLILEKSKDDTGLLIDFGAGLGYLSEILHKAKNFKILGLECDPERVDLAKKRQQEYYTSSKSNVIFEMMQIAQNSGDDIERLCKRHFAEPIFGCVIIGLHACADLSITAMKLFLEMKSVDKLIIMPCCYHKLELAGSCADDGKFKNFPLSNCLANVIRTTNTDLEMLNRPFLRLACQQTLSRWRVMSEIDHMKHGTEMFLRAAIECLASDEEVVLKRKGQKNKSIELSYEYLADQYLLKSTIDDQEIRWETEHKDRIQRVFNMNPNGPQISEGLTCLQTALQELFENIVLLDRVCFLEERAQQLNLNVTVEVRKILDDQLSPRCYAFIAEKHK